MFCLSRLHIIAHVGIFEEDLSRALGVNDLGRATGKSLCSTGRCTWKVAIKRKHQVAILWDCPRLMSLGVSIGVRREIVVNNFFSWLIQGEVCVCQCLASTGYTQPPFACHLWAVHVSFTQPLPASAGIIKNLQQLRANNPTTIESSTGEYTLEIECPFDSKPSNCTRGEVYDT
jgi:hypothetical protein